MTCYLMRPIYIVLSIFSFSNLSSDSFIYNSYNNHGVVGLINMPTARFYNEGAVGITVYDGNPDQKITMTSSPYNWLEASFFYTNIQGKPYPGYEFQDYKDKGFNFKARIKEEGKFPALAVGINDIAGTGFYSSEYIVGSYGIENIDIHFGLGWGTLNGSDNNIKNPFSIIHNSFEDRPTKTESSGGQFQPSRYFSGSKASPFYGLSYVLNDKFLVKIEKDVTLTTGKISYGAPKNNISYGIEYRFNKNLTLGIAQERGNDLSFNFSYKKDAANTSGPKKYKKIERRSGASSVDYLVETLESNGIGVNKVLEGARSIGIEVTQFTHPNLNLIEEILYTARSDAGVEKDIKYNYKIADLDVYSEFDDSYEKNSKLIYERKKSRNFNSYNEFSIRPFLASREEFFKFAIIYQNNSEYIIKDNFFFHSNLKYTIKDNFDDFRYEPVDVYPAQVRSDVKKYLSNFENRVIIGRAQFDYFITPKKNNHLMFTAGILEEMFAGYGMEYLYYDNSKNYALGFEVFDVTKRDYDLRFGTLDYSAVTAHANFYYRNYKVIPFDAKISHGKYLAGDIGTTFEISRKFKNGAEFGVFASFTDVTSEQFGEGTFDKGIFFNIPIYKNFINYTWRPLTKDPGAKLNRKNTLHQFLVKFKPLEE